MVRRSAACGQCTGMLAAQLRLRTLHGLANMHPPARCATVLARIRSHQTHGPCPAPAEAAPPPQCHQPHTARPQALTASSDRCRREPPAVAAVPAGPGGRRGRSRSSGTASRSTGGGGMSGRPRACMQTSSRASTSCGRTGEAAKRAQQGQWNPSIAAASLPALGERTCTCGGQQQ